MVDFLSKSGDSDTEGKSLGNSGARRELEGTVSVEGFFETSAFLAKRKA